MSTETRGAVVFVYMEMPPFYSNQSVYDFVHNSLEAAIIGPFGFDKSLSFHTVDAKKNIVCYVMHRDIPMKKGQKIRLEKRLAGLKKHWLRMKSYSVVFAKKTSGIMEKSNLYSL